MRRKIELLYRLSSLEGVALVEGKMRRAGSLPGKKALKTAYIYICVCVCECVCIYIYIFFYCKELAYVIMEAENFNTCSCQTLRRDNRVSSSPSLKSKSAED